MADHSDYLENLRQLRESSDSLIRREITRSLPLGRLTATQKRDANRILELAEHKDLSHSQLARIRRNKLRAPRALSFAQILVTEWESTRLGIAIPGRELDNKRTGYAFADLIGARRPDSDEIAKPIRELEFETPRVVKPANATGARGVFVGFSPHQFIHLRDQKEFSDWESVKHYADGLISNAKRPLSDKWFTEELILESDGVAARDLKFYAFYGKVVLALEYVRYPKHQARFWDRDGSPATTGISYPFMEGRGITQKDVETVEAISREIPRPYMRIDMLMGQNELTLGEFTPRPGGFEGFNTEWDRRFGEEWVHAEKRLISDLLDGKQFTSFKNAIAS